MHEFFGLFSMVRIKAKEIYSLKSAFDNPSKQKRLRLGKQNNGGTLEGTRCVFRENGLGCVVNLRFKHPNLVDELPQS